MPHLFPFYVLLFVVAFAAGAINSVAGGGTLLTFPSLLLVLGQGHAISANATSTVALVPGSISAALGYRGEIQKGRRTDLIWLGLPSFVGGALGAHLLLHTSDSLFSRLIPWLILTATFLFILQGPLRRWLSRAATGDRLPVDSRRPWSIMLFQLAVAVYGGFFGAGIGILMLTALGLVGFTNIHQMNGLKNFAAVCINGVAALTFILGRRVDWPLALLMMIGAIVGGYAGAGLAQRMGQDNVRRTVVAIGLIIFCITLSEQLKRF